LLPLAAVLMVLLSVSVMLLYGIPAAGNRLSDYAENAVMSQAATTASTVSETEPGEWKEALDLSVRQSGSEAIVVDREGRVTARSGKDLVGDLPENVLRTAANGERMVARIEGRRAAVAPLLHDGRLYGGVVYVSGESERSLARIFVLSGVEAALIASVVGGGLALLLAALLSRRVERLSLGARAIERGDLSSRIEPGFDDELGQLAATFNSMAARLEGSFSQLEEKGETLDAILNNLNEGVLATDLEGNLMFANDAARAMLGASVAKQDELPDPWEDFSLPEAVARCARERHCGEVHVDNAGDFLRVRLEHLPAFDEHRGGVLVVIQDLSEGRRLEEKQQRFLANAAHELKTPITAILGAAELLHDGDDDDPEVRRRLLDHILSESRRMQRLSETLLRLAMMGVEPRDPEYETLSLDEVATDAAERMEPLAESAGLKLRVEGGGGRVRADREWLEQCLMTLLGNAIRHSGQGDSVWLRAGGATIVVQDEGEGIDEEDLPYVFERFYRGDSGGFGLGLPICKELVERMGGEISIDSRKGVGTTVKIALAGEDG